MTSQYKLTETYNLEKVKFLLENKELIRNCYSKCKSEEDIKKEVDKCEYFLRNILHHNGKIEVNYNYSKKKEDGSGRMFADNGVQMISGEVCNFLLSGEGVVDIDIKNCGPTIIYNICKIQGLKYKYYKSLEEYIINREELIKAHYNNDKEQCKDFIKRTMFNNNPIKCSSEFEIELDKSFKNIQKKLSKCEEYQHLLIEAKSNNAENILGSFLNRVYTFYEDKIIRSAMEEYTSKTKNTIITIKFDGFNAYQSNMEDYNLSKLSNYIKDEFNMSLDFCYKPIESNISYKGERNLLIDHRLIADGRALEVAEFIGKEVKKNLVLCNETWFKYDTEKCLWLTTKAPARIITSTLKLFIDETLKIFTKNLKSASSEDEKEKIRKELVEITSCYKKINSNSFYTMLEKILRDIVCDNEFVLKLNQNKYQIAFRNGLMDLKTLKFREGLRQDDYLSSTILFDYKESSIEEQNEIHKYIKMICNCNEEHKEYYLSVLGYALTGDAEREKALWYLVGQGGNNGKTLIMDALSVIAPCYVSTIDAKAFDVKCNNRHKYLSSFNGGKRIIYMEEQSKKGEIDAKTMKQVADGKQLNNEKLYGTTETIDVMAKVFTLSNHTPKFDNDAGTENRYRQLQFNSEFNTNFKENNYEKLKFIADKSLAETLKNRLKNALLDVLIKYANSYYTDNYNLKLMPREWIEKTKQTIKENSLFKVFMEDNMEIGEDFKLDKKDIDYIAKSLSVSVSSIKDDLSNLNFKYDKEKRGKGSIKGVYLGIRLKTISEIDIDDISYSDD